MEQGPAGGKQQIWVLAAFDDDDFAFSDATPPCATLHGPVSEQFLGIGYLPVSDASALPLASHLNATRADDLRSALLEVEAVGCSARSQQVEIIRLMHPAEETDERVAGLSRRPSPVGRLGDEPGKKTPSSTIICAPIGDPML